MSVDEHVGTIAAQRSDANADPRVARRWSRHPAPALSVLASRLALVADDPPRRDQAPWTFCVNSLYSVSTILGGIGSVAKILRRRLAAILAADVVGYGRLMSENEAHTLETLRCYRKEVMEPKIAEHDGRIVKLMGDGLLAEFPSAVEAVVCAVEVQQMMHARTADAPVQRQIKLRIGINIGDVLIEDDDIYGDGVNIAARLEALAEPGGVCVNRNVYDEVKNKINIAFEDQGHRNLKNITEAIHVFRIVLDSTAVAPAYDGQERFTVPDKPSIAVLPFENLTGELEQEYLADGISEDIITALSKFRWFFVISRNSTFTFKGKAVSVQHVAQQLGVRYVLEGSMRKAGNRVRISAQLIDARNGSHIWAERYDRELADIFDLQDEMTQTIVGAIASEVGGAERDRARRKPPDSLDAWACYQRGLWHLWRKTAPDAVEAAKLFESAIRMDPGFSSAYAAYGYLLFDHVIFGWTDAPDPTLDQALQLARQAVLLDDKDAFGHFALGRIHTMYGEFDTAIAELETALEFNPNLALAYHGIGFALLWSGRARESLPHFRQAIRQSPRDPLRWGIETFMGLAHVHLREYEVGVRLLKNAARDPLSTFWPRVALVMAYAEQQQWDDARAALAATLLLAPTLSLTSLAAIVRRQHPACRDRFLNALRKTGLPE